MDYCDAVLKLINSPDKKVKNQIFNVGNQNMSIMAIAKKVKNILEKRYKRKILSNLNLKIARGDKISIIGANGSGKSTLINLITGLLKPSSGTIYCDDKKVTNKNLFQLFSILDPNPLFMNTNIYENICFKEKITHKEKWEINQILKIVELNPKNLAKYKKNIEAKFSQGEK